MCSKRVVEEEREAVEQVQEGDHSYPSTAKLEQDQYYSSSSVIHVQNMMQGGIHDYHSYTSQVTSPVHEQQPWHGCSPDDLAFPAAAGSYLFSPPPPPPPAYGALFNRRLPTAGAGGLQLAYELGSTSSSVDLRLISQTLGQMVQPTTMTNMPFGLQAEMGKMTPQEIMDAKALAASKSHSEAERRRRERINNHLAKLRSLLPSTTKTDKASLLAEVIEHVKELKRQTSIIAEQSPVPTETDELTIDNTSDEDGNLVIRASLCCEDRSDLLPDLIKTLKALRLRTLKAEITTLGGRMKNVLFITGDHDHDHSTNIDPTNYNYSISMIQEAFKAVMDKTSGDHESASSATAKRQRTNNINLRS